MAAPSQIRKTICKSLVTFPQAHTLHAQAQIASLEWTQEGDMDIRRWQEWFLGRLIRAIEVGRETAGVHPKESERSR
jgi:hypothetical protein